MKDKTTEVAVQDEAPPMAEFEFSRAHIHAGKRYEKGDRAQFAPGTALKLSRNGAGTIKGTATEVAV